MENIKNIIKNQLNSLEKVENLEAQDLEESKENLIEKIFEDTILELDNLKLESLNSDVEEALVTNIYNVSKECFTEYKEKLLDILFNRLQKVETFKGISSTAEDIKFRNIIRDFEDGFIQMPAFQRKYVWEKKRAAELISSLIYGIPIPPIYSYQLETETERNIIDGQQRLTSLLFYYYKAFPKNTKNRRSYNKNLFSLLKQRKKLLEKIDDLSENKEKENYRKSIKDLEKKISGMGIELDVDFTVRSQDGKIYDLAKVNDQVKNIIFNRNVNIITINSENKAAMAHIFNVYNTAGLKLTENEIRKAIYADNELYKNIIYISDPKNYKDNIEEEGKNLEIYEDDHKNLIKIIGNKDVEHSLFRMLSYNFNISHTYEKGSYHKKQNLRKEIIKKEFQNEDLVSVLNTETNYAKGKIYSLIDEYSNYLSNNKDFSRLELNKIKNFIKIISNSHELDNKKQYNIKNITCIYILLDLFGKLDNCDENLKLKEDYLKFEEDLPYKTLEKQRLYYFEEKLKKEGVISFES
ncbi:DUF262 domain-containing protein [Cetobacterium sp.]|uniref:DUF262 domain-containing protein n=1 Tax=Cetobacterium sp. TaxID=2071632 RepID=UPI003F31E87B